MTKCYVVILDWATEEDQDVLIIGAADSLEKAKEIFKEQLANEKEIADQEDYEIFEDSEDCFEAFKMGYWNDGHTKLWIQEVDVK